LRAISGFPKVIQGRRIFEFRMLEIPNANSISPTRLKLSPPDFLPLKAVPCGLGALAEARHPLSLLDLKMHLRARSLLARGFKTQYSGFLSNQLSSLLSMLREGLGMREALEFADFVSGRKNYVTREIIGSRH
jgi:hypothetical protein